MENYEEELEEWKVWKMWNWKYGKCENGNRNMRGGIVGKDTCRNSKQYTMESIG